MRFEIEFYEKENGEVPALDFINSLTQKLQQKVFKGMELLELYGIHLREPHSKALKNGIFELRVQFGSDIPRILYFFYVDRKIIFTNGFMKKQQKTPTREIEKAEKYREAYLAKAGKENERKIS